MAANMARKVTRFRIVFFREHPYLKCEFVCSNFFFTFKKRFLEKFT